MTLSDLIADRISLHVSPNKQAIANFQGLNAMFDKFRSLNTQSLASPVHVSITGFGDSMCAVGLYLVMDLAEKYGIGALYTPELGVSWNGAAATFSGGAQLVTGNNTKTPRTGSYDFSALPSSGEVNLPSGGQYAITTPDFAANPDVCTYFPGGSLTEAKLTAAQNRILLPQGIRSVRVFYKKSPGAGSVTAKLEQSLLGDVSTTESADAALALGVIDLAVTDRFAPITLKVSATTAAVRFLGAAFFTGTGGVSYFTSAEGSTEMSQQSAGLVDGEWNPVYASLFASLNPGLVFHAQRATNDGSEANNHKTQYRHFFAAYKELGVSQLVFAEPWRSPENALPSTEMNKFLQTECAAEGIPWFDRRSIVAEASNLDLGWSDGDMIHGDIPRSQFEMGILVQALFNGRAANGVLTPTLKPSSILADRLAYAGAIAASGTHLCWRNGTTLDGAAQSTYSAASVDSERGVKFASTAALGHAAARIGLTPGGSANLEMGTWDFAFSGIGYRNVNLPTGVEAYLVFGANATTLTSISALAQKCFGLQFAYGSDIGGLSSPTQEFVRIFYCDGSTTTYGKWITAVKSGQGVASGSGLRFLLTWTKSLQLFTLAIGNTAGELSNRTCLACSYFASNNTAGSWVHAGIRAANTDWGGGASATPSTTGLFQWREIFAQFATPLP